MEKDVTPQNDFKELIAIWKNMDRSTRDESNAALTFYDENIFPLVKEMFINNPKNRPKRNYDVLILTVGLSPEPLILSIMATKPQKVGLLHTPQTRMFLDHIQRETGLTLAQLHTREVDGSNVVEIYETIMALYTSWGNPANIAIDITGGKKSMVSGAAMAGAILGADIYYVDTDHFHRDLGKPEPGSEYLSLLDNPYTVFGDLEVSKAKDLYDRHDYDGAQRIFNQLEEQVGDPNLIQVYKAYGCLCATYEAWDNLNISPARTNLDNLLSVLNRFPTLTQLDPLRNSTSILSQHKQALDGLDNIFNNEEQAFNIPDGFHFAFILYHNALRREAQGKLDIACLLIYRLLEWIEQHRLAQYGIITSQPDYSRCAVTQATLLELYKEKREDVYKQTKLRDFSGSAAISDLPAPIALVDGFLILEALNDDIVEDLNWRALMGRIEIRNKCIFVHGMNRVSQERLDNLRQIVEERFEKAQEIAGIHADAFNKQHQFIAPLP